MPGRVWHERCAAARLIGGIYVNRHLIGVRLQLPHRLQLFTILQFESHTCALCAHFRPRVAAKQLCDSQLRVLFANVKLAVRTTAMSHVLHSYDQILNPSIRHCEAHGGNKHEGQIDEILVRWRPWVPPDSDEEDSERHRLGMERAVLFRMAIGPQCEGRHNVSIAAWYAPTRLDTEDMTEVGMLIDEGNQAILTPGEKVVFKFPKMRARCCYDPACKQRRPISVAIVAELRPTSCLEKTWDA